MDERHQYRRGRRHGGEENEPRRGREHKSRHRGADRTQHHQKEFVQPPPSEKGPFMVLKSLQESAGPQHHGAYVHKWLGQMGTDNLKSGREPRSSSPLDHPNRRSQQLALKQLQTLHKTNVPREDRRSHPIGHARREKRHKSTDSSLLQAVSRSPPAHERPRQEVEDARGKRPLNVQEVVQKRKYVPGIESSSESELPQPEEIFEKRGRHKTKKDRYDAKDKKSKAAVDEKVAKKKSKRVRRGEAAKISRAAGKDLIRSFTSSKIAGDRLTMRPGTGIFRNGKASSPSRKRGIADLAFSEMDFLSRSKNKPTAMERETVTSKHVQKVQRERERTRNEISTYFAPRIPLQESHSNTQYRKSPALPAENGATTVSSSEFGGTSYMQPESSPRRKRRPDLKEQFLGFGTNISSPRKFSLPPPLQGPIYYERPSVESARSESSVATSYVSWSETAKSPSRHGSPQRDKRNEQPAMTSSSPNVLRRRLLESGVLDGLGLDFHRQIRQEVKDCDRPTTDVDEVNRWSSEHRLSYSGSASQRPGGTHHEQEQRHSEDEQRITEKLRRRQIDVARRAVELRGAVISEDGGEPKAPRNVLASRAYLRMSPSNVPRRPATSTPVRQGGQNRVLSRSSLQLQAMEDPEPRDVAAQPVAEFNLDTADDGGGEHESYLDNYLDFPSHIQTPNYDDDSVYQQEWAQDASNCIVQEQMHGPGYHEVWEADYELDETEQIQYGQAQQYTLEQQDGLEQAPYQGNFQPEEETSVAYVAPDHCQPPSEPGPMNQYFSTPRGQSYFQQTSGDSLNLRDDSHASGVVEELYLKGFWTTKRW